MQLRQGDNIVIWHDDDQRTWAPDLEPKHNSRGKVIAPVIKVISRINLQPGIEPGIYYHDSQYLVEVDGVQHSIGSRNLRLANAATAKKRAKIPAKTFPEGQVLRYGDFISKLPDFPVWEYAVVEASSVTSIPHETSPHPPEPGCYVVCSIDTEAAVRLEDYRCSLRPIGTEGSATCHARVSDLAVLDPGNLYRHHHGQRLDFRTLQEQADFYQCIGNYTRLKSPDGSWRWNHADALKAVENDLADCWRLGSDWRDYRGWIPYLVYRYTDAEFGKQVRRAYLNRLVFDELELR